MAKPLPDESPPSANGGSRPVPDPTELTDRAIARLERSLTVYIDGKFGVLEQRLEGIDEATKLRRDQVTSIHGELSNDIARAVAASERVIEERFAGIQRQFHERDTRAERESRDNKLAVDAAFAAQEKQASATNLANEKAIGKSEAATYDSIDKLNKLFSTTIDGLVDKVEDVKDRVSRNEQAVTRIESQKIGGTEERRGQADSRTAQYATVGLIGSLILLAIAILGFVATQRVTP